MMFRGIEDTPAHLGMKVTVDPATGDELAAEVAAVAKSDRAILGKIKTIFFE